MKNALKRGLRTYLAVAGPALLAVASGADPFDVSAWKVALASGVPALVSFAWNQWLDPSRVPSLRVD